MLLLLIGLVVFLGVHSVRIVADNWRSAVIAERGENTFKVLYSVLSLIGFVLIIYGYGLYCSLPRIFHKTMLRPASGIPWF